MRQINLRFLDFRFACLLQAGDLKELTPVIEEIIIQNYEFEVTSSKQKSLLIKCDMTYWG
ncbi:MAG: hypothetical protein L0Y77_10145 [Chlorobi bacterium]|nr:hypothetical protein [Chlorobiota bacterium]